MRARPRSPMPRSTRWSGSARSSRSSFFAIRSRRPARANSMSPGRGPIPRSRPSIAGRRARPHARRLTARRRRRRTAARPPRRFAESPSRGRSGECDVPLRRRSRYPAAGGVTSRGAESPDREPWRLQTMTRFAALQTVSTPDVDRNLEAADRLVAQAVESGASWVALPEYFCLMGRRDDAKLAIAEADGDGPIQRFLAGTARRHRIHLVGGTLPIRAATAERVRNACCVYGPDGTRLARYDKIHLFAFDNGREQYDEARVLEAGDT